MADAGRWGGPVLGAYRVVDLSDERGQLCGHILAMLGAEVVLVEPPGGSSSRRVGPFRGDRADPDGSLVHWAYNRGKRSVVLDADQDGDRAELHRLVAGADFLIDSADPGELDGMGLDRATLERLNPALIHVSITAFGSDGPKSGWAHSDLVLGAASGVSSLTGDEDRAPLRVSLPQAFHHAAADGAGAALIALYDRQHHSGLGQHIDVSAQQSHSVATQSFLLSHPGNSVHAGRMAGGVRVGGIDTKVQLLWPCRDGQVSVTFLFGAALGPFTQNLMNWVHEEGFCDEATRSKDWIEYGLMLHDGREPMSEYERVKQVLTDFCMTKTKAELLAGSFERRVLITPVVTTAEVIQSEHWRARDFWDDVECGPAGRVTFPGAFARFSATPVPNLPAAVPAGRHTAELRSEPDRRPHLAGPEAGASATRPLAGLKVLDFMWVFAGPHASRQLADFGAQVVRIESSTSLDALRTGGNFQDERTDPEWAMQFSNVNAGKLGVGMDLSHPEARGVVHDLVRWADIVLESFSPRAMAGWDFDYASLREVRPDLVMASSCLMGQTGPHRQLAGFGTMAAAISGFFHITGWPDRQPCGPFLAYTDYVSPRFLLASIMAALEHRRATGEGQYVDLSQAEATMQLLVPAILDYTVNGRVMERKGNADPAHAPHGVYATAGDDQWVAVAVTADGQWRALCDELGRADLAGLTVAERLARWQELDGLLAAWTADRKAGDVMARLQELGIPAHQVQNTVEAFEDPQLQHRGHFVQVPHDAMGTTWVEGSRLRMSRTPAVIDRGSPTIGQHTWQVLTELLGYDDDRVAELAAAGLFE
jgi:crotonobetainyl-CoA:carnitine CoA-transferase CaiB-like acyl-CoA transferase